MSSERIVVNVAAAFVERLLAEADEWDAKGNRRNAEAVRHHAARVLLDAGLPSDTVAVERVPLTAAEETEHARAQAEAAQADRASAWRSLREIRDKRLRATDGIARIIDGGGPSDYPADKAAQVVANKTGWLEYRQALRDLPQTVVDPRNVVWPAPPPQPPVKLP